MSIAATARIYPWAKIIREAGNFSVGDHSQIDDFAFVNAGRRCSIGRFVHIASFVSIIGGGEFAIDDFAGLSAGVRVITGTDDYMGPFLTNPTVPREFTAYHVSYVHVGKSAIVGTNAVVFPGVTIGEGAAVGACAVVRRDLAPWGIYAGDPKRLSASLIFGKKKRKPAKGKLKTLVAPPGGMAELVEALGARLTTMGADIRLGVAATDDVEGNVVMATSARDAAGLIRKRAPRAAQILDQVEMLPLVRVTAF